MHKNLDLPPPPPLAELVAGRPVALFLDFDGTLVEIADTPGGIAVPADLDARLHRLRDRLNGRLAIVSGRSLADLGQFLEVRDLIIVGSHGAEMGEVAAPAPPISPSGRARIDDLAHRWPGILVETKPHGIAVHYRQEPDAAPSVFVLMDELAESEGLAPRRGKMVVELGPRCTHKGTAVAALLATPGFEGATPWFIGDDVTDEDGFAAVLDGRGHGILVGPQRPTAADFRLDNPTEVHRWLNR